MKKNIQLSLSCMFRPRVFFVHHMSCMHFSASDWGSKLAWRKTHRFCVLRSCRLERFFCHFLCCSLLTSSQALLHDIVDFRPVQSDRGYKWPINTVTTELCFCLLPCCRSSAWSHPMTKLWPQKNALSTTKTSFGWRQGQFKCKLEKLMMLFGQGRGQADYLARRILRAEPSYVLCSKPKKILDSVLQDQAGLRSVIACVHVCSCMFPLARRLNCFRDLANTSSMQWPSRRTISPKPTLTLQI